MSANRVQRRLLVLGRILIAVTVMVCGVWVERPGSSAAGLLILDAEVLEGSLALEVSGLASESVHYAVVHHHMAQDQFDLSAWLRSRGGSPVTFVTKDGRSHQGVLNRLKHCFGRGLLIYSDRADLAEKELVRLELPREAQKAEPRSR